MSKHATIALPRALEPLHGDHVELQRLKSGAVRGFTVGRAKNRCWTYLVALHLRLLGRQSESEDVARFLSEFQFDGNFNTWEWSRNARILLGRQSRLNGDFDSMNALIDSAIKSSISANRFNRTLLGIYRGKLDTIPLSSRFRSARIEQITLCLVEYLILREAGTSKEDEDSIYEQGVVEFSNRLCNEVYGEMAWQGF